MNVNCLIVDDEQPARDLLEAYVGKVPFLNLVAKCRNPIEAMSAMQQQSVDLLFLDIQMPELKGNDFLRTLQPRPVVIFTTAYPDYALEGYQLEVSDYLLKPFPFERFLQAVNKAAREVNRRSNPATVSKTAAFADEPEVEDYLLVKADHRLHRVKHDELVYVEGLREYVTFWKKEGKIVALESLKKLEEKLPDNQFMRVHKSYIINTSMVGSLYGNQVDVNGKLIPIGKSYRDRVLERLFRE